MRAARLRLDQTKNPRGGGVGGFWARDSAEEFTCGTSSNCGGGIKGKFTLTGGNSSFCICTVDSFFCSDFFPAAIALQRRQGCFPSKVFIRASCREGELRVFGRIVVHA